MPLFRCDKYDTKMCTHLMDALRVDGPLCGTTNSDVINAWFEPATGRM